jgi:outer membrane lipoprotein-sorting protein
MKRFIFAALVASTWLPTFATAAQDAAAKGQQIARESERRDAGWKDARVTLTMILQDRKGNTRERKLRMLFLEVPGDAGGDKSIAIFDSPPDMKGTLLLTHTKVAGNDDQWLYLPSLKRVKRISSSNRTGAFFGSEFTYEDIAAPEIARFSYNYTGNKPCASLTCFVVERKPLYKNSGYSVMVTYFDTAQYRPQKIEYFDRKGKLTKVLTMTGYKKLAGRFWRASTFTMKSNKTGRTTVLKYGQWKFATGLDDASFSKGNLRNIR